MARSRPIYSVQHLAANGWSDLTKAVNVDAPEGGRGGDRVAETRVAETRSASYDGLPDGMRSDLGRPGV
jgi:hypothetical protein